MNTNTVLHVFHDRKPEMVGTSCDIDLGVAPGPFVPSVFETRDGEPFQVEWLGMTEGSWIVFYNR